MIIIYIKAFDVESHSPFQLKVEKKNDTYIFYYPEIEAGRDTTKDSHQKESFVVFLCVCQLFELGYKPFNLVLEGLNYQSHNQGWIDILVKQEDGRGYMIIECKTTEKFQEYWKKTLNDGDQLFRYFNTYRQCEYLCLFTCDWINEELKNEYHVISLNDNEDYIKTNDSKGFKKVREENGGHEEFFKVWKETYKLDYSTFGIFEKGTEPFKVGTKAKNITDLKSIDESSMLDIIHNYANTLLRHNISNKENAFDKLVNLFISKIIDERGKNELAFQWKGTAVDNYYYLQDRLHNLYKEGMSEFFDDDVTYVANKDVDDAFQYMKGLSYAQETVRKLFYKVKYFNNNPFTFLDVHNKDLFLKNSAVLTDIVRIFQDYKLKESDQNESLYSLFETLLVQGFKQELGQYFTPMPIVRFMVTSLPLNDKIKNGVPKVADIACGSGHFLTEYASQISPFIKKEDRNAYYKSIVGVEKDYRLSKVAQVSAYMYGQEGIKILYADSLANNANLQNNKFDIIITNPPYSVKFLDTLTTEEKKTYNLYTGKSDGNSENGKECSENTKCIEAFFLERVKQLLKSNGVAAILMPKSIITSGKEKLYERCREILLSDFDIIAMFEAETGTIFGGSGCAPVILFLRRRVHSEEGYTKILENINLRIKNWFENKIFENDEYQDNIIADYCKFIGVPEDDYLAFIKTKTIPSKLLQNEIFNEYQKVFETDSKCENLKKKLNSAESEEKKNSLEKQIKEYVYRKIEEVEIQKIKYFYLASKQQNKVLVIKTSIDLYDEVEKLTENKKQEIQKFLGYRWNGLNIKYLNVKENSDDLDEDDSIKMFRGIKELSSDLINPTNPSDPNKINTLIRENYNGQSIIIPKELQKHVSLYNLIDLIDFSKYPFDKELCVYKMPSINSSYSKEKLKDLVDINPGDRITNDGAEGQYPVYGGGDATFNYRNSNRGNENGTSYVIARFAMSKNCVRKVQGKFWLLDSGLTIITKVEKVDKIKQEYIELLLFAYQDVVYQFGRGSNQKNMDMNKFKNLEIPLPDIEIQNEIVEKCSKVSGYKDVRSIFNTFLTKGSIITVQAAQNKN